MNIAIFGGSFDPPHIGHEKIVEEALDILDIDKLIIVPTYLNPFKSSFKIEPQKRLQLIQELFVNTKSVEVSSFEIEQNRSVYAIETVEYFSKLYKPEKIYFIIGADNLEKLHLWHNYDKLSKLVEFVVVKRDDIDIVSDYKVLDEVDIDISSTHLRDELDMEFIPQKIRKEVKDLWLKD